LSCSNIAGTIEYQSFGGNGGAGDVAAQGFQLLALMGGAAHLGMEAEALRVDTAHWGRWRLSGRDSLEAQQGPERGLGTGVGQVGHPRLFRGAAGSGA
jgi:hypothetical protein